MDLRNAVSFALALSAAACGNGAGTSTAGENAPAAEAHAAAASQGPDPEFDADDGARPATALGDPIAGSDTQRFQAGKTEFETVEDPQEGLGPILNDVSCAACHSVPVTGGGSTRLETRFARGRNAGSDPLQNEGGTLIQERGIGVFPDPAGGPACNYVGETVPKDATTSSKRRTTPLFGLGLVDAMTTDRMNQVAAHERQQFPGQAGHVAILSTGQAGKFGWKCQVPTLQFFSGDAYLNEMGVTSPDFPNENCPQGDCSLLRCNPGPKPVNDDGSGVQAFADFMTMLAPPPRGPTPPTVTRGQEVFLAISCNACHTPRQVTASGQVFHPYSDFLLHNMGSLGDGIPLGGAGGQEFRTAPLWGLNRIGTFLHDGRANNVTEAIQAHSGQGASAKGGFNGLSAADKQALLDFLNSL